jgi:hypothetical protein
MNKDVESFGANDFWLMVFVAVMIFFIITITNI